jgi:hypothetical protein
MPIAGIGLMLGKTIEAVTKALSRIREGLRNCISERTAAS